MVAWRAPQRWFSFFTWRHGGRIGVLEHWNGGHVCVPNQYCGSWTLSLCKRFLLLQLICIAAGHVRENCSNDNWSAKIQTSSPTLTGSYWNPYVLFFWSFPTTLTRISCNLILKLYLQQLLFLTISKHNIQFVTPKSKNKKLQGDPPQTRKNYRCCGFMENSVLQ